MSCTPCSDHVYCRDSETKTTGRDWIDPDFHPEGNPRLTRARDKEARGLGQEAAQANLIDGLVHPSS